MPPRKKKRELSQTAGAIAKRELTRQRREKGEQEAAAAASGGGDGGDKGGEANTGSIGVQSPAKPAAQSYHCSNCEADVTMDMKECPTCEIDLNWPE